MNSRRLLLVESDPAIHEQMARLLNRDGQSLQAVDESAEALQFLRATPYDLVFAGKGRNGNDGMSLLRRIYALRPEAKVIVTGERSSERVMAALRGNAFGYLHEPFSQSHLTEMVQQALESDSWRDDIRVVSGRLEWLTLEIRCKLEAVERATHFVRELAASLDSNACEDVSSAFRELLLNGVEHGGKLNPKKRVRVSMLRGAHAVMVHMRDPGKGFSINEIEHAAVCNPQDSPTRHAEIRAEQGQRPGGFGILMARNLVDELLYNERGNEVFFVKNLT
ncbi:MAG: ATP-binding protein [Acidobacteriia bacterium]|nr:ATP-binding protein [Terriglobia bacterium]